jgi:hypothetical protein
VEWDGERRLMSGSADFKGVDGDEGKVREWLMKESH